MRGIREGVKQTRTTPIVGRFTPRWPRRTSPFLEPAYPQGKARGGSQVFYSDLKDPSLCPDSVGPRDPVVPFARLQLYSTTQTASVGSHSRSVTCGHRRTCVQGTTTPSASAPAKMYGPSAELCHWLCQTDRERSEYGPRDAISRREASIVKCLRLQSVGLQSQRPVHFLTAARPRAAAPTPQRSTRPAWGRDRRHRYPAAFCRRRRTRQREQPRRSDTNRESRSGRWLARRG